MTGYECRGTGRALCQGGIPISATRRDEAGGWAQLS